MYPQFVQRYIVKQNIPIITISSSKKAIVKGALKKDDKIRGVLKDVSIIKDGKRRELSLLQFGENKYVVPKYILLEPLSGVDDSGIPPVKIEPDKKAPILMKFGLPVVGLGLGLLFAHRNRSQGLTKNTTISYIGYGLLGLFLGALPIMIFSYNQRQKNFTKTTGNVADEQKNKALVEKAYQMLVNYGKKAGKKIELDKDAFTMQFNSLDTKEKEAFIFIGEETMKLSPKDKMKFIAGVADIGQKASERFGADTIKSLSEKTTLPS